MATITSCCGVSGEDDCFVGRVDVDKQKAHVYRRVELGRVSCVYDMAMLRIFHPALEQQAANIVNRVLPAMYEPPRCHSQFYDDPSFEVQEYIVKTNTVRVRLGLVGYEGDRNQGMLDPYAMPYVSRKIARAAPVVISGSASFCFVHAFFCLTMLFCTCSQKSTHPRSLACTHCHV